jgi:hypothetical protein
MLTASRFLDVTIVAPAFTLVDVPGYQTVWDSPQRARKGVYLWCVEYRGGLLASYVGKTSDRGGFERRLWTELCDWRKGRYWAPLEIDSFLCGKRKPVETPDAECLARELIALEPATRILLAPLETDEECVQVESFIVDQLRRNSLTYEFLGNRDKATKYNPKPSPTVRITSAPSIIGLTSPIAERSVLTQLRSSDIA